jgi:hypothetical protein
MPIPTIRKKEVKDNIPEAKRKKLSIDSANFEAFERCKEKYKKINSHLRKTNEEEIVFDLEHDIDKALRSLGIKYEKALDDMIAERMTVEPQHTPEEPQSQSRSGSLFFGKST